jgi:hypothetical protein
MPVAAGDPEPIEHAVKPLVVTGRRQLTEGRHCQRGLCMATEIDRPEGDTYLERRRKRVSCPGHSLRRRASEVPRDWRPIAPESRAGRFAEVAIVEVEGYELVGE